MVEYIKCNLCYDDCYDVLYPSTITDSILQPEEFACTSLRHGHHHKIVRCRKCGLIYSNPRDPSQLIENFYRNVKDETYCYVSQARIKTFKRAMLHLERYRKGFRLLDLGCYTGLFMDIARLRGWEVFGIEPSVWASMIARDKNGLCVINGSIFDEKEIKDNFFDVITMWDVLEHLVNPRAALEICHRKLSKGGIIAISTMRCEGVFFSLCGHRWPWFMRMHLFYFTLNTLSRLLKEAGFRILGIHPYVHYIGLNYFFYKMASLNKYFLNFLKNKIFQQITFPVNLGDFVEVYAAKA